MFFYSTANPQHIVDFRTAALHGQPPDKGLYFPERIPQLSASFVKNIKQYSKEALALEVINPYVGNNIDKKSLENIVAETINFPIPLQSIGDRISVLELFHGPTLAFKDVGARFMSRCISYFSRNSSKKTTVLVATSGDTGGAVAHAFLGVANTEVIILYPSGKVSELQEKQLTTLGDNITALEVAGNFDDCQALVKTAFADAELQDKFTLTSANSINVARWLPQQFYYFLAAQQWEATTPPVVAVPSGNFGNICGGLLAHLSGLPVLHFIAACNANNTVPRYFDTEQYEPQAAIQTLSNAMDVGDPSNFVRILHLFKQQFSVLSNAMSSVSVSDEETVATMKELKQRYNYLPDPHGAVAYHALKKHLDQHTGHQGYFLETAHPAKFDTANLTGLTPDWPPAVTHLMQQKKVAIQMESDFNALKSFLLQR